MDIVATVTSVVALGVSIIAFYWTTLRKSRALYLLRIENFSASMAPEFALVNGGNSDVLITRLACSFQNAARNGWAYPPQQLSFRESDSFLLCSGKGFHCKVKFPEPFTKAFALDGEKKSFGDEVFYMKPMRVEIEWADMSGDHHAREVILYQYGFDESGRVRTRVPEQKRHELYEKILNKKTMKDLSKATRL